MGLWGGSAAKKSVEPCRRAGSEPPSGRSRWRPWSAREHKLYSLAVSLLLEPVSLPLEPLLFPLEQGKHKAADDTGEEAKESADLIRAELTAEQGALQVGGGVLKA